MEEQKETMNPWEALERLITEAPEQVPAYLHNLEGTDAGRALLQLNNESRARVLEMLTPEDAVEVLSQIPVEETARVLSSAEPEVAARVLENIPHSRQADVLGDMEPEAVDATLEVMDPTEAADAINLTRYEDDEAGGLMSPDVLMFPEHASVGDVLSDFRANRKQYADYDVQYVYIVDHEKRPVGVLRLRDLILASAKTRVSEISIKDPSYVQAHDDLETVWAFFEKYRFFGAPVVDVEGRLVGTVRREAVEEAVVLESARTFRESLGIVGGEELRTMPFKLRAPRRLSWLSANIVLNVMAAGVIVLFEDTLASVIALAAFLPVISDMSGCSGNQAVAVSIRELSLGLVKPREVVRVLSKEIPVGIMNGVVLGSLLALVAWVWKGSPHDGTGGGRGDGLQYVVCGLRGRCRAVDLAAAQQRSGSGQRADLDYTHGYVWVLADLGFGGQAAD